MYLLLGSAKMVVITDLLKSYWENLGLLSETGQNIVGQKKDTLTAKCLHEVFKISVDHEDMEILQSCITLGMPLNDDSYFGITPLMMCIDKDNPDFVEKLIMNGADVNLKTEQSDSPLHYCIDNNKLKAAEVLVRVGKNYNLNMNCLGADGLSPLHRAAKNHYLEMITTLVSNGADVNIKGSNGYTPLHVAANCTNTNCMRV